MMNLKNAVLGILLFGAVQTYAQQPQRTGENVSVNRTGEDCTPIDNQEYTRLVDQLENPVFDGETLSTAKSIVRRNCLSATQMEGMIAILATESERLEFAEHAYGYCSNPEAYYNTIKHLFTSSSSLATLQDLTR